MGAWSKLVFSGCVLEIARQFFVENAPRYDGSIQEDWWSSSSKLNLSLLTRLNEFLTPGLKSPSVDTPFHRLIRTLTTSAVIAHVVELLNKKRYKTLALAFAFFPKFRIPGTRPDADRMSLLGHLWCFLTFHRVGMKLPPQAPLFNLLRLLLVHGFFQRHLTEAELARAMGPIWRFDSPYNRDDRTRTCTSLIMVSDPDMVAQVMKDKETYPSRGDTGFSYLLGEGLLGMKTGPKWHTHRRVVSQFLSNNYLRTFSGVVQEEISVFVARWKAASDQDRTVNAYYDLSMLTLDAIMRIAFGIPKGDPELSQGTPDEENYLAHELDHALKRVILQTLIPWVRFLPEYFSHAKRLDGFRDHSWELADRIFEKGLQRIEDKGGVEAIRSNPSNMLEAILVATDDEGNPALTKSEMRDELITIRGAGHETTSNTLCWCLYYLQRNPEKLEKLRAEVDEQVAGESPTYEESLDLAYCTQVVYEGLRLRPTVPSFPRVAERDTKLQEYDIPATSYVLVSQHAMNRNPKYWEKPDDFIPERFNKLPQLVMSKPVGIPDGHLYGFLPFGAGPRTCIGQRLAMAEAVQILAAVVKNFNFELDMDESKLSAISDVTMGPKKSGLWLKVSTR